eukprot:m.204858 g.204858  ORF g.204858 m.204858 type:complete len:219 (+) comp18871_c0_seq73:626-1282(+)
MRWVSCRRRALVCRQRISSLKQAPEFLLLLCIAGLLLINVITFTPPEPILDRVLRCDAEKVSDVLVYPAGVPIVHDVYKRMWMLRYLTTNVFKIDLSQYEEKMIHRKHVSVETGDPFLEDRGPAHFLLTKNSGRQRKRKGLALQPARVSEPFDDAGFHFLKAHPDETLFFFTNVSVDDDASLRRGLSTDKTAAGAGMHFVVLYVRGFINLSCVRVPCG